MDAYWTAILLWISRISGIKNIEKWANRIDRRRLVFTRVRGEYLDSRVHLSITAFNPSGLPRIIRDLTLHCKVSSIPYMFRLSDANAGRYIEDYRIPAHSISTFTCEASLGEHAAADIITIHFTYLDEKNFRHHVWIDAPGRYQPS